MTAPRDPDDLASALLDGRLTDDEAAAARRDPAVAARLAELAAVRDAVGRPPAGPDPAVRERGLAAALAAYDAGDAAGEGNEGDEPVGAAVSPLGRARAVARPATPRADTPWRLRGRASRRWLTAAAVLLVVVGLGVLARNWDSGNDDTDTAALEVATDEGSNDAGGAGSAAEGADSGTTEESAAPSGGPAGIVDLGDVDSADALADRARSILAARFDSGLAEGSGGEAEADQGADGQGFLPPACSDDAEAEVLSAGPQRVVLQGRAVFDGEPVDVWVLAADGEERVVALDASCAVVVDQPLQD
ncbi:MAG TPA: hypothetical protein VFH30_17815 [Acidimicrobiales bacterium]|nr:hypothetical protein [Acidimicrobiales bacterium]